MMKVESIRFEKIDIKGRLLKFFCDLMNIDKLKEDSATNLQLEPRYIALIFWPS